MSEAVILDALKVLIDEVRGDLRKVDERLERLEHRDDSLANQALQLNNQIVQLQRRIEQAELVTTRATDVSLNAMRTSEASQHEINSISAALMLHLARMEESRSKESSDTAFAVQAMTTNVQALASDVKERDKKTDVKLDDHKKAIAALAKHGLKLQPWQLTVITVVLSAVVAIAQIIGRVTETWIEHKDRLPATAPQDGGF